MPPLTHARIFVEGATRQSICNARRHLLSKLLVNFLCTDFEVLEEGEDDEEDEGGEGDEGDEETVEEEEEDEEEEEEEEEEFDNTVVAALCIRTCEVRRTHR